jgi:hypothetical protein
MRTTAMSNYLKSEGMLQRVELSQEPVVPKLMLKLIAAVDRSSARVLLIDSRADMKRKMIHTLRQSLMLTPRSRGGVNPNDKLPELPPSALEKIIDATAETPKGEDQHV